jgi:dTDP-4-amino-4,6-dideoxygalactose transaminase
MHWRIPLADLNYDEREEQAVLEIVRSRWLTMGAVTERFESEFARSLAPDGAQPPYTLAVANGTVALHLACRALGIGPGDEVIVPALTFVATANAVLYTGAQVRFAEVTGAGDLNISPQEIERQITPRTRAIIVVHYGGFPCDMPAIMELANRYNLAVIEDAAHAPGAFLDGKALGTWGDIGCFSFFSNKNLSTGEGGMLVTHQEELADRLRVTRSHGMTSLTWDRHQGHAYTYDVVDLGYNYRIDEIRSALGLVQLEKLVQNNARRRAITHLYWDLLEDGPFELPFQRTRRQPHVRPSFHIFPVLLPAGDGRLAFMEAMRARGVQTSVHYPPVHRFSYYRSRFPGFSLPRTEALAAQEVTLPLYAGMAEEDVRYVVESARSALSETAGSNLEIH